MKTLCCLVALSLFLSTTPHLALAQTSPSTDSTVPETSVVDGSDATQAHSTLDDSEAQAGFLFDVAMALSVQGNTETARGLLEYLLQTYPDSSVASNAESQLTIIETQQASLAAPPPAPLVIETNDAADGRAEFMTAQTLMSTWVLGFNVPFLLGASDARAYAATMLLGIGAGLAGSAAISKAHPITSAQASSIFWGELWTGFNVNFLLVGLAQDPTWLLDSKPFSVSNILSVGVGAPLGYAYQKRFQLSAGQVAAGYSAALWGAAFGEIITLTALPDLNSHRPYFLVPVLLGDVALALSTTAFMDYPISRGRTRLVNLGGTLGALVAGGLMVIVQPNLDSVAAVTVPLMLGAGGGLVAAWQLTRDWDRTRHPHLFDDQATSLLSVSDGRLKMGRLAPTPHFSAIRSLDGDLAMGQGVMLPLASGRW